MGFSTGFLYLCLFGTYALAFWYGAVLIMEPDSGYSIGVVLTVFFSVIIGAFGIAQVKISNWVQSGRSLTTDCIRSYIKLNGPKELKVVVCKSGRFKERSLDI